ncbi:acyltransferase family protein [Rhizorhapis sp. SPR117]|uniref:acyltransferase family protein n=1 Tax=Rhizorhapis sp. SPR117 TaxID=2912611 RepID=UPI001F388FAE
MKVTDVRAPHLDSSSPARLSAAIAVARVLCIVGVIYAHAWTGLGGDQLDAANGTAQGTLRWVLTELLGRSAVPLLGMISGWLVMSSASSRSYNRFIAGKARTILLPMLAWNALAMLIISGGAYLGFLLAPVPGSLWIAIDQLFCLISPNETNVQMAFLRDLFICMAMAPLLVRLPGRWLVLIAAGVALWSISGVNVPVLLRPAILLFFIGGILTRQARLETRVIAVPLVLAALAFGAVAAVKIWLSALAVPLGTAHPLMMASLDLVLRFAAALFFWRLSWFLAGRSVSDLLLRIEPYVFLVFCAHLIMMWLGGPLIGTLTGPLGSPLYPPFLLLQPLLVVAAAIGLGRVLGAYMPSAARLLSGGRLKARKDASVRRRSPIPPGSIWPPRHSPDEAG